MYDKLRGQRVEAYMALQFQVTGGAAEVTETLERLQTYMRVHVCVRYQRGQQPQTVGESLCNLALKVRRNMQTVM